MKYVNVRISVEASGSIPEEYLEGEPIIEVAMGKKHVKYVLKLDAACITKENNEKESWLQVLQYPFSIDEDGLHSIMGNELADTQLEIKEGWGQRVWRYEQDKGRVVIVTDFVNGFCKVLAIGERPNELF